MEAACQGVDVVHADNVESFRDCTIIEDSLTILSVSFDGFQHVFANYSFGAMHDKMHPSRLEVFSTVKEVTGFVNIQGSHPDFVDLSFFRNLEVINGQQLTEFSAALYIVKTSLRSLNLRSLRKIRSGSVAILENQDLCFASSIDWNKIINATTMVLLRKNGDEQVCEEKGLVCHPQCSRDGCWGMGPNECLSCVSYSLGNSCVENCNSYSGLYDAGNKRCEPCDDQCLGQCFGPGPRNCSQCRSVRDGPYCYAECPETKYNHSGECLPCHKSCVKGCTGPENTIGEGGCNYCEKVVVSTFNSNVIEQCLKEDEPCPDGFYSDYISPQQEGPLKSLTGKSICRKCHQRCKSCTSYGIHISVCDCLHYRAGEQCEAHCPRDHFADEANHQCVKCAEECEGCNGPTTLDCIACRNYRIYVGNNHSQFNCTSSCPPEKPFKKFDENTEDPYCTDADPTW